MACRSVSSSVSRDLDPRLSDADITHSTASLKGRAAHTPSTQLNCRRPDIEVIAFN
jgi:hypothetical protein